MSSAYLTFENMSLIDRLLVEVRVQPRNSNREAKEARFLIDRFQQGITTEIGLRECLNALIRAKKDKENEISRWLHDGGAARRGMTALFGLLSWRSSSVSLPKSSAMAVARSETQRHRDSDTVGQQRRENEVKSRNQMH